MFVRFGFQGAAGPIVRVRERAVVRFWDVGFNLWTMAQALLTILQGDGEPGGALEPGVAVQVDTANEVIHMKKNSLRAGVILAAGISVYG